MLCHGRISREGITVYFIIKIKACNNRLFKKTLISLIIV